MNVGEKTLIYHGRWRNAGENHLDESIRHYLAEVALATLPLDRWGSLSVIPGKEKGVVLSCLTELKGNERISLNADGLTNITVSLLDEKFIPIAGYENTAMVGDSSFCAEVKWNAALPVNKNVYIQVEMKACKGVEPKLYAIYIE